VVSAAAASLRRGLLAGTALPARVHRSLAGRWIVVQCAATATRVVSDTEYLMTPQHPTVHLLAGVISCR